jgi:hypothetical protein
MAGFDHQFRNVAIVFEVYKAKNTAERKPSCQFTLVVGGDV